MTSPGVIRIFGFVHLDGRPASPDRLALMGQAVEAAHRWGAGAGDRHPLYHDLSLNADGSAAMGCLGIRGEEHRGPEASSIPWKDPETGITVAADLQPHEGKSLVRGYLRRGQELPSDIDGDFAIALWDPGERGLLLARDPLGCAPLFYARVGDTLFFASNLNGIVAGARLAPDLDPEWVAGFLVGDLGEGDRTAFPEVRRLPAGHRLWVTPAGGSPERFWDLPVDQELSLGSDEEYEEAFRSHLEAAVWNRIPGSATGVGSELSGGLDSSVVTSLAHRGARARGLPFAALSHQLSDDALGRVWPYVDEREWAERVRRHAGIERHIQVTGEGDSLLDAIRRAVRLHGAPPEGGYSVMPESLYGRARVEGVTNLFSGFGGDEGVSGSGSMALEGWIVRRNWRALLAEWRERGQPSAEASRRALIWVWGNVTRWPDRRRAGRSLRSAEERAGKVVSILPVDAGWAERVNLRDRGMAPWLRHARAAEGSNLRAWQRHQILRAETTSRLESSAIAAGAHGLTLCYPLLDSSLLDFFQRVPHRMKWRGGEGRRLYRRGVTGLVPDEVRLRVDKQGVTVPTGIARLLDDEEGVRTLIRKSKGDPGLRFLDLDGVDGWLTRLSGEARTGVSGSMGELMPGCLIRLLALMVYQEGRREGWRPGSRS